MALAAWSLVPRVCDERVGLIPSRVLLARQWGEGHSFSSGHPL